VIPLSLHILPPPHTSPLFPYTTLFRSHTVRRGQTEVHRYKLSRTRYSVGDREGRYRLPRKNVCVGRAADAVRPQSKNWGPLTRLPKHLRHPLFHLGRVSTTFDQLFQRTPIMKLEWLY